MISLKITVLTNKDGNITAIPEIFYIDEDNEQLIDICSQTIKHCAYWLDTLSGIKGNKLKVKELKEYTIRGERNIIIILPEYIDTFIEELKQKVSSEGTCETVEIENKRQPKPITSINCLYCQTSIKIPECKTDVYLHCPKCNALIHYNGERVCFYDKK